MGKGPHEWGSIIGENLVQPSGYALKSPNSFSSRIILCKHNVPGLTAIEPIGTYSYLLPTSQSTLNIFYPFLGEAFTQVEPQVINHIPYQAALMTTLLLLLILHLSSIS